MRTERTPPSAHIAPGEVSLTTFVTIVVVAVAMVSIMFSTSGKTIEQVVPTAALVAYALILGAAVSVYFHWRAAGGAETETLDKRLSGWLTVALVIGGLHGLAFASDKVALLGAGDIGMGPDSWPLVSQVVAACLLCGIASVAERRDVVGDPAWVGVVGGLVLTALTFLMMTRPLLLGETMTAVFTAALMLAGLNLARIMLGRTQISWWVRQRLALAAVAMTLAQCIGIVNAEHRTLAGLAITANLVGAVVLCATAQSLLRRSLATHREQMRALRVALQEVEAGALEHRELLHEVGSTLAGIASASTVIRRGMEIPEPRRARLEEMLESEVARLMRLMNDRAMREPNRDLDVDDVVEPIVLSHQARGRDVRWTPTGVSARGDADDLAEVVNVLLENAARHGGSAPVTLVVSEVGGVVQLVCSDEGPGVSPLVRDRLFESEVRSPASPGQGLGLAIAHRLMSDRGGDLELLDDGPGATFVASLPVSEVNHVVLSHAS